MADSISAREFILVGTDHNGKEREIGRWGHTAKGGLVFDLGGTPGHPRVRLSGEDQSSGLVAWSPSGYPAAKLIANHEHGGRLLLYGKRDPNAAHSDPIEAELKEAEKYEIQSVSFLFAGENAHLLLQDRKDDQRIDLRTRNRELNGPILELKEPIGKTMLEVGRPTKTAPHRLYYLDSGERKPVNR